MPFHEDYSDEVRAHGEHLGERFATGGPRAILEELENLVPQSWRDQVAEHPIVAMLAGTVAGIFLGARVGDEMLAAGSALVSAAAAAHVRHLVAGVGRAAGGTDD